VKVTGIEWDAHNRAHFAERGRCSKDEVEDVIRARCNGSRASLPALTSNGEMRRQLFGRACSGRFLVVVVAAKGAGLIRPITCWPLEGHHLAGYLAWQRTVKR